MFKKILQAVLFCATVASSGWSVAAPVGYIHEVKGTVTIAGKQPPQVKVGDTFEQGANFTTGANGQVTLKFEDGQIAILAPNTNFIATTYVYNKARVADGNIVFNLLRGGLRFVSGVMTETNPAKFAVRTPTATAGVRGSAGTVVVSQDGQRVMASTTRGSLSLTVGGNTVVIPINQSSAAVGQQLSNPALTSTILASPGAAQALLQEVANLVQILGAASAPPNSPVSVQATANAIAAAVAAAADPGNATLAAAAATALNTAITENQAAITAAIAGGAAAGAGTDTGGTVDVLAPPATVPTTPNTPATSTSTGA